MSEEKKPFKLQEYIKNNNFGFLITLGAVIFQALHTQYTLKLVSSLKDVFGYDLTGWHSFGIAILISGAILYFTLRDNYKAAIGWACFETYMNLCYYTIYITNTPADDNYLFWIAIPASFALPTILGMFAYELVKGDSPNQQTTIIPNTAVDLDPVNKKIDSILNMTNVELEGVRQTLEKTDQKLDKVNKAVANTDKKFDNFIDNEFILNNIATGSDIKVKIKKK